MRPAARRAAATLATIAAALATAGAGTMPADEAQRAYQAGRYADARRIWEPLARDGDVQAQFGLGLLYDLGQGVARDPLAAYLWYRHAAEAGLAEAQFNVAAMHDTGEGVPRDPAVAATWYARAAAHGNRRAQYNLGQLYAAGDGVPRNLDEAEVWYRAAAAALPDAGRKLAGLPRAERAWLPPGARPTGALVPARPAAPADGARLPDPGGRNSTELVWVAPPQPQRVRFFVELLALDGAAEGTDRNGAEWREAFSAYLDETATVVPLARAPGRYAWRVYTVGPDAARYAASPWVRFSLGAPE